MVLQCFQDFEDLCVEGSAGGCEAKTFIFISKSHDFFSSTGQQRAGPRPGGVGGDLYFDCFQYKLLADLSRLLHALRPGGLGGFQTVLYRVAEV